MTMHRVALTLLLAGCISVSAYYVPGTYPQEFLTNAPLSGAVQLLLCNSPALFWQCSMMHANLIIFSVTYPVSKGFHIGAAASDLLLLMPCCLASMQLK
jgi:hypothetical protein